MKTIWILQGVETLYMESHTKHLQDVFNHVIVVEEVSNLGIQFLDFENLITDIYTMSYGFVMYKDHFLLQCKDPDMQSVS